MLSKGGSLAAVLLLVTASYVGAQAVAGPVRVPRFEAGGQAALLVFLAGGDGFFGFDAGPRLTVNLTQRDALEIGTGALFPNEDVPLGLYFLQYKRVIRLGRKRPDDRLFITIATGGDFDYNRNREQRSPRPDGSVEVRPARTTAELNLPWLFSVGIGAERVLARYVASRGEAQVLTTRYGGVGFRGMLGLSMPVGGHYARQGQ